MTHKISKIVFSICCLVLLSQLLLSQEIVVVEKNNLNISYYDKILKIQFTVPSGWIVKRIGDYNDMGPNVIGLKPEDWGTNQLDSADQANNALLTEEYAIRISVKHGTIGSILQNNYDSSKVQESPYWRYYSYEYEVVIYAARSGRMGPENAYEAILDNRKGRCVRIDTDPVYILFNRDMTDLLSIQNSIRFE